MKKHFLGYRKPERKDRKYTCRRNSALVARYYYLSEIHRLRFDDVVSRLSVFFFISETYIMRLLCELEPQYTEIMDVKPSREELKKQFPYYDWS